MFTEFIRGEARENVAAGYPPASLSRTASSYNRLAFVKAPNATSANCWWVSRRATTSMLGQTRDVDQNAEP